MTSNSNMLLAAPELLVLIMACVILCVDLFLREERRGIIHLLALITLVFADNEELFFLAPFSSLTCHNLTLFDFKLELTKLGNFIPVN